ncbi:MAG: prephenate dehydrogenase [Candidatus Omnitrophota bacterium]
MKLFNKITIIGVGLIGGSLGLAIKKKRIASKVVGFFRKKKSAKLAKKMHMVDVVSFSLNQAVKDADLVILATPVETIKSIAKKIVGVMKPGSILIDVGSTKKEIVQILGKLTSKKKISFLGCHPMAGSEKSGLIFAKPDLFEDSICFLTSKNKNSAITKIKNFWTKLGAKVVILEPAVHDKIVAEVSHLSHIISFALINCINNSYLRFSGPGLRESSRLASSDSIMWRDIALSNKDEILRALKQFKASLNLIENLIAKKESRALEKFLLKAKNKRDNL